MKLTEEESLTYLSMRRSVFPKELEDERVGKEEIGRLLDAAKWAPTHKVTEPWFFVVMEQSGIDRFKPIIVDVIKQKGPGKDPIESKIERTLSKLDKISALIAIVMKRDELERIPEDEELWATACAVQNVQLHATSMNIGCYWSTGLGREHPDVRQYLGLSKSDRHMGWLFLGRFKGEKNLIKERKDADTYTRWV